MRSRSLAASPRVNGTPQLRLSALVRQMASSSPSSSQSKQETLPGKLSSQDENAAPPVLFRSELNTRTYVLNRPKQLNALDQSMLELLKSKIEEWEQSPRCHVIIGTGNGRAFCAGGDVKTIVQNLQKGNPETGIRFFKEEFELDYALARLKTPYIAILDGVTMGGGVGLSINAMFRVATENTVFAMPETKIGYSPDVGASFFLPRLDGALGTYLGLTGESLRGREVFESGIATHYVASHRIPALLERLNNLDKPTPEMINDALEEFHSERLSDEPRSTVAGSRRKAVDMAFSGSSVEDIMGALSELANQHDHPESGWAKETLETLELRSPTSIFVAFEALREGKQQTLGQALSTELGIATAYCTGASPDFVTGVKALLIDKAQGRPEWAPNKIGDLSPSNVLSKFFSRDSPFLRKVPETSFTDPESLSFPTEPMKFSLPSEEEIGRLVRGEHPSSSSTAFSLEELLQKAQELWGKQGVEAKIKDVVSRRCEVVPKSGMQEAHVLWIH